MRHSSLPSLANELVESDRIFRRLCPSGDVNSVPVSQPNSHRIRPARDKALNAARALALSLGTASPSTFDDESYSRILQLAEPIVAKYPKLLPSHADLVSRFLSLHHRTEVNETRKQLAPLDDHVIDDDGDFDDRVVKLAVEFEQLFVTRRYDAREREFPPFEYRSERYRAAVDAALDMAQAWKLETDAIIGPSLERF